MKVFLVGEAASHADQLRAHLDGGPEPVELVELPADAGDSPRHDGRIGPADVVVSLALRRPDGQAPPFRLLQVPGAGLDRVELAALRPDTSVANVFEHEIPIAEYVLARLLEWEIRAAAMQARFGSASWASLYRERSPHGELYGKTLCLLGYGRIGRAIATRAHSFGVRVLAVDEHPATEHPGTVDPADEVTGGEGLSGALARADYVVVACPLTPATTGLIDTEALRRMPRRAVLVNVSRAAVVEETALYRALCEGEIAGAVLDVWYRYPSAAEPRPAPAEYPFWELPNAWCTPHSSAWTDQLSGRRYTLIAENINRLVSGRPLLNLVRAGTRANR